ncbi:hypothetical protein ACFQZX_09355 [Mucilaginibacter litoreus]|uniref:YXWGXW repeat-containing protein n=1 Tax=Mucilaginibacter litoreus TaxID=1048221 RepID=A0ABW3ASL3_9SPHI
MKRSVLLSAILLGALGYNSAKAQISVHIGFNIPARPVYVPAPPPPPQPVVVYDTDEFDDSDDYYYLPEVEAYYSVPRHCYFYMDGGRWVSAAYLPGAYRSYDWRTAVRYEVRARRPYMHHDVYRGRWGGDFNRGRDWNHRSDVYAGRRYNNGFPGRRNNDNRNRWNDNRGEWNHPDENRNRWNDNRSGWNRPDNNRRQNDNRGGWNRPDENRNHNQGNNGGWDRRDDNKGRGQEGSNNGGWSQPGRNNGNERRNNDNNGRGIGQRFAQNNGGGRPVIGHRRF